MNVLSALLFLTTILKYAMIYEYLKIYEKGLEIKTIRNYGGKMNTLFRKMKKAGMLFAASAVVFAGTQAVAKADVNATSIFGPNVYVFDTNDSTENIQKKVDEIYSKQEKNQFGSERYAILFKPGTYSQNLHVETGFYTEVSGLGISPEDTVIGNVNSKAEWMTSRKPNGDMNYNATCNFWRSVENLTLNISTSTSREKQSVWAVSQRKIT